MRIIPHFNPGDMDSGRTLAFPLGRTAFVMDNRDPLRFSWGVMDKPATKLTSPASLAVDAVLVIVFFIYMYTVVSTHVPSKDHRMILFWGALCSACLTLVFWLTLQMFRVVIKGQREQARGLR
jgi:hypothetical protein